MTAQTLTIDFRQVSEILQHKSGKLRDVLPTNQRPRTADGKLLTPKQIRARARRRADRATIMSEQEQEYLYRKPVSDWDQEELAHGRPRATDGSFRGAKPAWITRAVHEEAMERYTQVVKASMNVSTNDALSVLQQLINDDERDDKGKPIVPAGVKLEASKFLIEHVIGKPKQRIENDVSVTLQGILAQVMVNPAEALMSQESGGQGYTLGHYPGLTMPMTIEQADEMDEFGGGDG